MDIIEAVLDDIIRERKIRMVLADADIEEYIKLDLSGHNENEEGISQFMKKVLVDKKMFKEDLCQKMSILRLGYIMRALKGVHGDKASMLGAEAFIVKINKK